MPSTPFTLPIQPARRAVPGSLLMLLVAVAALVLPGQARADRSLEAGVDEPRQFLYGDVNGSMDRIKALGATRVRTNIIWNRVAPSASSQSKPSGFEGWKPDSEGYDWSKYDRIINAAAQRGLDVYAVVTGPGPVWASETPRRKNGAWKPSPLEFGRFAEAAADRYGDRVDRWGIYNEPNQGGWLQPQSQRGGGGYVLRAPHHYRDLVNASYDRIEKEDPSATILLGNTAPTGRDDRGYTRPIRPLTFWRTFGCVSSSYKKRRSGYCRNFERPEANDIGHHPHPVRKSPTESSPDRNDAAIADTTRFMRNIDWIKRANGLKRDGGGNFGVYYTEFSYQTNPPDVISGVGQVRQSLNMQEAQYIMWRHSRVRGWMQYQLNDEPLREKETGRARYGGWQGGIFEVDGDPKPYARTYTAPIWRSHRRRDAGDPVRFWGQSKLVRSPQDVLLQYRNFGSSKWRDLQTIRTNGRGYFSTLRDVSRSRYYRFIYPDGKGGFETSTARSVRIR
ncbi:MAG: hypothetical protein ACR2NA_13880 [Solirubrobacterales bacterium]